MRINIEKPFEGDSTIAFIGIVAAVCAIIVMVLFMMAKKITDKNL